jgi:uncharacterized protein with HEPN domain
VRRDEQRLRDILEAIAKIERFAGGGRAAFDADERTQVWCVHHIQVIGEAARALSEDFRRDQRQVPWSLIIGMRHILVHDYFGIDLDEVWAVVERDLPTFREQILAILGPAEPAKA